MDLLEVKSIGEVKSAYVTAGALGVYSYITDGIIIDTGSQSILKALIPFFDSNDYDQVLLTHYHEDHTGGCAWIQANKNVPIYIHPMSIDICAKQGDYPDYRKQIWGVREGFEALPIEETFQSRNYSWEVIYTPGHSPDHVSFLNQSNGVLFSGDLFVTPKTKVILQEELIPSTMDSIEKVLQYEFQEVFCAHAGYMPNGKEMLRKKLDYLKNLEGEVFHLNSQGLSIEEIQQKLLPASYPIITVSDHEWDSKHMITSILGKQKYKFE